jgi:hypothetical protein
MNFDALKGIAMGEGNHAKSAVNDILHGDLGGSMTEMASMVSGIASAQNGGMAFQDLSQAGRHYLTVYILPVQQLLFSSLLILTTSCRS